MQNVAGTFESQRGFTIEDKEVRGIPLPDALVKDLKAWKATRLKTQYVLGTDTDRPNKKLLRGLKRLSTVRG